MYFLRSCIGLKKSNQSITITSRVFDNTMTVNRIHYSTITGSSVATNSLLLASTLTGSSIILSGNVLNSGTINDLTLSRVTTSISVGVNNGYGTGGYNVVYGSQSGNSSFTGNSNVMLGYNTGQSFTSASGNTLVGIATGNSITTGISNTLVGYAIGNAITTGFNNIVVGYSSGISMTTCEGNVIMGKDAGAKITTGRWNVAIGERALAIVGSLGTGDYNVAVGHYTFPQLTTGTLNVGVGAFAGTNVTTGTYNAYIGYNAVASGGNVNDEIVIGASATGAGSNTITLGNSSNTKTIFTGGNVGIGTTTPVGALSVKLDGNGLLNLADWTSSYALFGPGVASSRGTCVGITYNTADNFGALISLTPMETYRGMKYNALYHEFYIQNTQAGYVNSSGFNNGSDEREKINITSIKTAKSLERILACRPTTFQRIMDRTDPMITDDVKNKQHIGLIAQEILEINPHCISEWKNKNGESRYGINYTDFVTHLIGAVQEHNKTITSQVTTITDLQSQVATLQSQVEQLLTRLASAGIA